MKMMLNNVRLAFPRLWKARSFEDGEPTFGALLILTPDNPAIAQLEKAFTVIAEEKWAEKAPGILKTMKMQDRLCLHDGSTKAQYSGFEGNMFVSANSKMRPSIFDRNRAPLSEEDGRPYSGCYVNASIELWRQDHPKYGKRINAQLRGVQFFADGDAFAAGTPASDEDFPDLSDQGEDSDPTA